MCRWWGAGVPCCLNSLLSFWPAYEVLGWLCQMAIGTSTGCCVSTHWLALSCMVMRESCQHEKPGGSGWLSGTIKRLALRIGISSSWDGAMNLRHLCLFQRLDWLSKSSPTQREPPALLSHSGRGWLTPCAGSWPSQTAGMCVPVRVSSWLLPSDAVWAGVTLSAAMALAKHHGQLHKRR